MNWEYLVRSLDQNSNSYLTHDLDKHGANGWELVAFNFTDGQAIFKRPVPLELPDAE